MRLLLSVDHDRLRVGTLARGEPSWNADVPLASADDLLATLEDSVARQPARSRRDVTVLLHPPLVQTRTLGDLPPVGDGELRSLVQTQASRFFRLNGGSLVVGAVWMPGDPPRARAAACDHALVAGIEAAARRAGAGRVVIRPEAGEPADRRIALETPGGRRARLRSAVRATALPLTVALGCWAGAGLLYLADLSWDRRAVSAALAELEGPLAQIRQIETELDAFLPVAAAVRAQGPEGAWAGQLLARLGDALPDSSLVTSMEAQRDGLVRLELRAQDPGHVLESLTMASFPHPMLADLPVSDSSEAGRGWSRFTVSTGVPRDPA